MSAAVWLTLIWDGTRSILMCLGWHAIINVCRGLALAVSTAAFLAISNLLGALTTYRIAPVTSVALLVVGGILAGAWLLERVAKRSLAFGVTVTTLSALTYYLFFERVRAGSEDYALSLAWLAVPMVLSTLASGIRCAIHNPNTPIGRSGSA